MVSAKGEAGNFSSRPLPRGTEAKGLAGQIVSKPSPPGAEAKALAGQLAPLTARATAQVAARASADITLQPAVSVDAEVNRAPFNPIAIAERIAENPEFYRRLASFIASELANEAERCKGQGNAEHIIKGQLLQQAGGFADLAGHIAAQAYDKAANVVISIRDGLVTFSENHPQLVANIESLSVICLSTFILGDLGVSPNLSALISVAIVNGEKLTDLIKAWRKSDK